MAFGNQPISLTVPSGAGDADPRTVIGNDIPDELLTFYSTAGYTMQSVTLYYVDGSSYWYTGTATRNNPGSFVDLLVQGSVRGGTVEEFYRHSFAGPTIRKMEFGAIPSSNPAISPNVEMISGELEVGAAAFFRQTGHMYGEGTYSNDYLAVVTRGPAQSVTNTPIAFTAQAKNQGNYGINIASFPSTTPITIPYNGWYTVAFTGEWASSTGGYRAMGLLVNGALSPGDEYKVPGPPVATTQAVPFTLPPRQFLAGDTIGINAFTNTAAINIANSRLTIKLESRL